MILGRVIKKYRLMSEKNLRDMAAEIGVSPATLMRIEHGRSIDAATLVVLLNWLTKES